MLLIAWLLWSTSALAGPRASAQYYETNEVQLTLPSHLSTKELSGLLRERLQQLKFNATYIEDHTGQKIQVGRQAKNGVPYSKLSHALTTGGHVALAHELKGAELDIIVVNKNEEYVPVSIWWNTSDKTFVMKEGEPIKDMFQPVPDALNLVETFGIGPLVGTGRQWTPKALGLLYTALSLLPPEVRAYLKGLPFHREAKPSKNVMKRIQNRSRKFNVLEAIYAEGVRGPSVTVYDSALQLSGRFVGDPIQPRPPSVLTLLHEMGHAFAEFYRQQALREHAQNSDNFEALRTTFNALVDKRNHHVESMANPPTAAQVRTVQQMDQKLNDQQTQLTTLQESLSLAFEHLSNPPAVSPAAEAMLQILGKPGRAPTPYGRTSPEEAFAECFALFYVDPLALKRANKEVYAWFQSGGHFAAQSTTAP